MSYLVIARKWRPQVFDEVVGQPHVTRTLQNAVRSKRVAHAYLFTGARGVGKTSVARILAKTLNCEGDMTAAPCNACSNCREITQGNAVDVLEIDGASNRGIDDIRELRETVRYRPSKSRYKIYIIDEVHMLTDAAFNALLKTLEEPPEHVVFVFATTEPHKIPATILSRCQRFDFRRIPIPLLVGHLRNIADQEQAQLSDGVIYAVAREADGSMRDAQSLLEQLLAFSGDGLSDEDILDVLGVVDRRSVHRVGTAILDGDVGACLDVANELHRRGIDSRRFCQQLCDHFRNLLFLAFEGVQTESPMDLPREEKDLLRLEIAKTTPESLYLYFQMILKGEEEIRRSSLPRITLEMLLLRLSQLPRLESLETVLEKIAALEDRLGGVDAGKGVGFGAAPAHRQPPPPQAAAGSAAVVREPPAPVVVEEPIPPAPRDGGVVPTGPVSAGEVVARWGDFQQWLQAGHAVLFEKLKGSRVSPGAEATLELEVMEIFEDTFKDPKSLARLSHAARDFFGQEHQWVIRRRSKEEGQKGSAPSPKAAGPNPRAKVLEHPAVMQAIEILGGELVDIRRVKTEKSERTKEE